MEVGDKFKSYEQFYTALAEYKKSVNNEFWIRDARTIENQRRRSPDTVKNINKSLKYYYLRLSCVKGGRVFKSKNEKSNRKCTTYKQDCEATIFVRVSGCKQYLCILELKDNHNHKSSKTYFTSLTQQRLKLPENVKNRVTESLKDGANKKVVLDKIRRETGCKITLKDLTNLGRRKTEKKTFEECVNILINTYGCCDVEVLIDKEGMFKGLYFQDKRMKKYFDQFPEMLFIDGTYCLVDLKTATYIIMIEDGCGLSEIIAVCLLVEENEECISFFIETFKSRNPAWDKVQVIMSDKDKTERKVFKKYFPAAKLMICLFHVFQIFNREVSFKKMGITSQEVQTSKQYLQKLAYSSSESEYHKIYNAMIAKVPEVVKYYYDSNWATVAEKWVQYLTLQNLCFTNKTNNRLESINSKLKSVINRYSPLEDFIKHLYVYINSSRVGKDVKNSQMLSKKLVKAHERGSAEQLYSEQLTTFAFEKVLKQLQGLNSQNECESIGNGIFLVVSSEGLLQVSAMTCECLFRKSTQLPCRHIFKCRSILLMPLFDINLCLNRWTRSYYEKVLDDFAINNIEIISSAADTSGENISNLRVRQLNDPKPKYITNHKKFKLMDEQGKKMAQLCSEVSTNIFRKRLKIIETITKCWEEGQDSILSNILKTNIFENLEHLQEEENEDVDGEDENEEPNELETDINIMETIDDPNCDIDDSLVLLSQSENEVIQEIVVSTMEDGTANRDDEEMVQNLTQSERKVIIEYINNNNVNEITTINYDGEDGTETQCDNTIRSNEDIRVSSDNNERQLEEETFQAITKIGVDEKEQPLKEQTKNAEHRNSALREEINVFDEKENLFQEYEKDNILQNIKMPNTIKKRGRPKGSGNTVIGLKRKRSRK